LGDGGVLLLDTASFFSFPVRITAVRFSPCEIPLRRATAFDGFLILRYFPFFSFNSVHPGWEDIPSPLLGGGLCGNVVAFFLMSLL